MDHKIRYQYADDVLLTLLPAVCIDRRTTQLPMTTAPALHLLDDRPWKCSVKTDMTVNELHVIRMDGIHVICFGITAMDVCRN